MAKRTSTSASGDDAGKRRKNPTLGRSRQSAARMTEQPTKTTGTTRQKRSVEPALANVGGNSRDKPRTDVGAFVQALISGDGVTSVTAVATDASARTFRISWP